MREMLTAVIFALCGTDESPVVSGKHPTSQCVFPLVMKTSVVVSMVIGNMQTTR